MPKGKYEFDVETDQGTFTLTLDKPPRDDQELRSLAEEALAGGIGPESQPSTPPTSPGYFDLLGEELSQAGESMAGPMAPLGIMQAAGAPLTALGRKAGHATLEATGSPVAAGIADAATSVGSGMLLGGAGNLASRFGRKVVAPRVPGAGTALLEEGIGTAENLATNILPQTASDVLFSQVAQQQGVVSVPRFRQAVEAVLQDQGQLAKFGREKASVVNQLETTLATLNAQADEISFQDLVKLKQDIGATVGALRRSGGPELGQEKQLFRALTEDLDNSTGPAALLLKSANRAFRRESASEELGEIVRQGINRPRQGSDFPDVSYATMAKKFDDKLVKDDLFKGSFSKTEIEDIKSTLHELGKISVKPPGKGVMAGSFRMAGRAAFGMLGGQAIGLDPQTGAALGIALSSAIESLLQTTAGRKTLLGIIRRNPRITMESVGLLSAAARATSEAQALGSRGSRAGSETPR